MLTKQEMFRMILEHRKLYRNIDAAEFFGVTPQTMLSRRNAGNFDPWEIYQKCPEISADWLLSYGEGEMLTDKRGGPVSPEDVLNESSKTQDSAKLTEALRAEQEALKRAQEQISSLISMLPKPSTT